MIIGFLIGIAITILGIYVVIRNKRLLKGRHVYAVVQDCQPSSMNVLSAEIPCSMITLEIPTSRGIIYKQMRHQNSFAPGETMEVYYDEENDKLERAENVRQNSGSGPYILIGFGVLWCVIMGLCAVIQYSDTYGGIVGEIMGYAICIGIVIAGFCISVIGPRKRKKEMENCHMVKGHIADYKKHSSHDEPVSYTSIYEFYDNGENVRIEATVSGTSKKYCQIGREVTIVINDVTGKVYCKEDANESKKLGWIFLIVGIIFLTLMILYK